MQKFNVDHQAAILDGGVAVAPGEPHDFTAKQIAAGLAGRWSDEDPRAGLIEEREFKRLRDASRAELDADLVALDLNPADYANKPAAITAIMAAKTSPSPDDETAGTSDGETTDPAEPSGQ